MRHTVKPELTPFLANRPLNAFKFGARHVRWHIRFRSDNSTFCPILEEPQSRDCDAVHTSSHRLISLCLARAETEEVVIGSAPSSAAIYKNIGSRRTSSRSKWIKKLIRVQERRFLDFCYIVKCNKYLSRNIIWFCMLRAWQSLLQIPLCSNLLCVQPSCSRRSKKKIEHLRGCPTKRLVYASAYARRAHRWL